MSAVIGRLLVLIGLRRSDESVRLFTTWHSYAAVLVAALVIAALIRFS